MYDIILVQEPHTTTMGNIRTPTNFRPVFPTAKRGEGTVIRSVIWVNRKISTQIWKEIRVQGTGDISGIQIWGEYGKLTIFNIYNPGGTREVERVLDEYMSSNGLGGEKEGEYIIWAGDFNRHHPMWDRPEDGHLFNRVNNRAAERLIRMVDKYGLAMALPRGIPTLQHMVSKRYSRPDNVFCTANLLDKIEECNVAHELKPASTDHFPIITALNLEKTEAREEKRRNFRTADWEEVRRTMEEDMRGWGEAEEPRTREEMEEEVERLTRCIAEAIEKHVPLTKPLPDEKRWWTEGLEKVKKAKNRIGAEAYRQRAMLNHPVHRRKREAEREVGRMIMRTKVDKWTGWLSDATTTDLWTANNYLKNPGGDGGRSKIPSLRSVNAYEEEEEITSNDEKAHTLASAFFPPPPVRIEREGAGGRGNAERWPTPLPDPKQLDEKTVERHVRKMAPYKACGPDGIPNVVYQQTLPIILTRLTLVFRAALHTGTFYSGWKEFTTVVLRKPGKPDYRVAKAYRPIALLNSMSKILTSIVAEDITNLVEKHSLIPNTHFGGRPGRTTTDALHYLVMRIKEAWRRKKAVSILFLDVEGAFPNAVTEVLLSNLRRRRIPKVYVNLIANMLEGRHTRLKFDDYVSNRIPINNGIGQGDPLSMILYIIYNSGLLEVAERENGEDAIGFVDDVALVAEGDDVSEAVDKIWEMMEKRGGGLEWSEKHNSKFEVSKSVVMHAAKGKHKEGWDERTGRGIPVLEIGGEIVKRVTSFKYLGVYIDDKLSWGTQSAKAQEKATKWALQFRRLARPTNGIRPKLMRQLYNATVVPKMTYALDVWYTPPTRPENKRRNIGSVGIMKKLTRVQRMATLAITGAPNTTPTTMLDAHADVLPLDLRLQQICHRNLVRMATLPETHPLHPLIVKEATIRPKKHQSPISELIRIFDLDPRQIEKIDILPMHKPTAEEGAKVRTVIRRRAEKAVREEGEDKAEVRVYTDAATSTTRVAAAALLYNQGEEMPSVTLTHMVGRISEHSVLEGELTGILMAIDTLGESEMSGEDSATVYTDSKTAIRRIRNPGRAPEQGVLKAIHKAIRRLRGTVTLRWIPGHKGIRGNEEADKIAKDTANRITQPSDQIMMPMHLRQPTKINPEVEKKTYKKELEEEWNERWRGDERRRRKESTEEEVPLSRYHKATEGLKRSHTSLLIQIRSDHLPLNARLYRIGKARSSKCPKCTTLRGGERAEENTQHLIYECVSHRFKREKLWKEVGGRNMSIREMTEDAKRATALVEFVISTGRVKMKGKEGEGGEARRELERIDEESEEEESSGEEEEGEEAAGENGEGEE